MTSDKILYYPYINIPDSIWTSRALLYWDNVGVIVPEEFIRYPDKLEPHMQDLVKAQLVDQVIPLNFTENLPNFKKGFEQILKSPKFDRNSKHRNFVSHRYSRIHVEKFNNEIMQNLHDMGLARFDKWPWWNVETETANILMTYLASVISIMDERSPVTDTINEVIPTDLVSEARTDERMELRNRLLNDILPLPTKIEVSDLEKIKGKYKNELTRFRNNIEKIILDLTQFEDTTDFEDRYKLQLKEIKDSREFIADKLSEPRFGKIVFGTLCSLSATGIAIAQTPHEQIYWTIPSILTAVYSAVDSHRRRDIWEQPLSYLALIDRQLKIAR